MSEQEYVSKVLTPARLIDRSSWWIDNRETSSENLPELLADPGLTEAGTTTENPF